MKKHNPLIDDAIKRNEDALTKLTPGTSEYQKCRNRIERHRHDSIMEMLIEISKPKKIEKIIMVFAIFAVLIAAISLCLQFYGYSDKSQKKSDEHSNQFRVEESKSKIEKTKSSDVYDLPKSSAILPRIKYEKNKFTSALKLKLKSDMNKRQGGFNLAD